MNNFLLYNSSITLDGLANQKDFFKMKNIIAKRKCWYTENENMYIFLVLTDSLDILLVSYCDWKFSHASLLSLLSDGP